MHGSSSSSSTRYMGIAQELDLMPTAKLKARAARKKDPAAEAEAAKQRRQEIIARGLQVDCPMISMQTVRPMREYNGVGPIQPTAG